MLEREIKVGQLYRHFKGTYHRIVCIAKDSETLEDVIVYTHEDSGELWVRKKDEFMSLVNREKYPDVIQEYRFELVKD